MSTFDVPGAQLYYETRGSGPLMLMIPGANGDADAFGMVAEPGDALHRRQLRPPRLFPEPTRRSTGL
ncbi:hypothetical protein AS200_14225 [Streptomyces sp. CdTB01]|nr:hypothetical protein AS200_14225 [Streptomyces sp. CdTB01]